MLKIVFLIIIFIVIVFFIVFEDLAFVRVRRSRDWFDKGAKDASKRDSSMDIQGKSVKYLDLQICAPTEFDPRMYIEQASHTCDVSFSSMNRSSRSGGSDIVVESLSSSWRWKV